MSVYREVIEPPAGQSLRVLAWEDSLSAVRVSTGPDRWAPIEGSGDRWHAHRAVELTYIHSGSGVRFIGDNIEPISPPELVLIGANVPHYWRGLDCSSGAAIQFDPALPGGLGQLPEVQTLAPLWARAGGALLFAPDDAARIGPTLRRLPMEPRLARAGLALGLLGRLEAAADSARRLCEKSYTLSATAAHADKVSRAIDLLLDHFAEELRIDDIAQAAGLSRATLCRYFRKYTGKSVVAFLNEVRLDHARRMLVEGATPIAQIAFDVGFGNLSNFNRQFKRATGETPRAYRQRAGIGGLAPPGGDA